MNIQGNLSVLRKLRTGKLSMPWPQRQDVICTILSTWVGRCGKCNLGPGPTRIHLKLSKSCPFISIDATADNKRYGRLLNHCKSNPNVVTKLVVLDQSPYLCLMAARDICQGEQLEYDYGDRSRLSVEAHPWLVK